MTVDPIDIRYERVAAARERCLQEMRRHLGEHLPRPVIMAVSELAETALRLGQIPDDVIEETAVHRLPQR